MASKRAKLVCLLLSGAKTKNQLIPWYHTQNPFIDDEAESDTKSTSDEESGDELDIGFFFVFLSTCSLYIILDGFLADEEDLIEMGEEIGLNQLQPQSNTDAIIEEFISRVK